VPHQVVAAYSSRGASGTAIGIGDASGVVTFTGTGSDVFAAVAGPPGTGADVMFAGADVMFITAGASAVPFRGGTL
jgi:hypothetical protein